MKVREECGIAGIYFKEKPKDKRIIPELLYSMLSQLQHRGQLSAGVSVYNPLNRGREKRLKTLREVGEVDDLFKVHHPEEREKLLDYLNGIAGIGHVRYATSGAAMKYLDLLEETQPFERLHGRPWKRFSIAFNGNLANYSKLRKEMRNEGYLLDTNVDTEIIKHLVSLNLKSLSTKDDNGRDVKPDLFNVVKETSKKLDGAYNVISLFADGDLLVWRDSFGFKPLVWGENSDFYAIASESVALENIDIKDFFPVIPGSCMIFNKKNLNEKILFDSKKKAYCHFERVYFSRAESIIDGKSINSTREDLGEKLAKDESLKNRFRGNPDCIVVPVPKTPIPAAEAYSREMGVPWSLAITDTGKRGFINKKEERGGIMDRKYGVISERIEGKIIILIDDSIVRGETSKKIISLLKKSGAKEIHLRSTEPPIKYPCFYGIDFPTYGELIASRLGEDLEKKVARYVGADSVVYQSIDGLVESIGFKRDELCLACLTGKYPTRAGQRNSKKKL